MRYGNMTCESYCRTSTSQDPTDPIFERVESMIEVEKQLEEVRQQKLKCITINQNLQIVVTNQIGFDECITQEQKIMKDLSQFINFMNIINDKFREIEKEFPRISAPNLVGLRRLKAEYKNQNATLVSRIKSRAADRLQSLAFGAGATTMDETLNDPNFKKFVEEQEAAIAKNEQNILKINEYIGEIENIFVEIFGDE